MSMLFEPSFLKAVVRVFHFIGLGLGLGTATFLDLLIVRFMVWGTITRSQAQAFHFGTRIVAVGLVVLWVTGLLFLFLYLAFEPVKLGNPKIWAKLSIVGVLTGNAFFLHSVVLPIVERQVSRTLFTGTTMPERIQMVCGGALSLVSWYVPVALGTVPHFNFSVSAQQIWLAYCCLVVAAMGLGCLGMFLVRHMVMSPHDLPKLKPFAHQHNRSFREE
jgi:hypothetical protein